MYGGEERKGKRYRVKYDSSQGKKKEEHHSPQRKKKAREDIRKWVSPAGS
jgi:hypothetical protein